MLLIASMATCRRQAIRVQKWYSAQFLLDVIKTSSQQTSALQNTFSLSRAPRKKLLSTSSIRRDDRSIEETKRSGREEFFETRWSMYMNELRQYVAQHGNANVPGNHPQIGSWIERQRAQYRLRKLGQRSSMSDERIEQLNSVGFIWNTHDQLWDQNYQELVAYFKEHGHSLVPNLHDSPLGLWVHKQRRQYQKLNEGQPSSMTEDRMALLNELDFIWDAQEAIWMEHYKALCHYRDNHGHCLVPKKYTELGRWVDNQRQQYKLMKEGVAAFLTPERIELLEDLDFEWNAFDAAWKRRRDELAAFVDANGLGSTPRPSENPALSSWIRRQRQLYLRRLKGEEVTLTEERIAELDKLGFVWKI